MSGPKPENVSMAAAGRRYAFSKIPRSESTKRQNPAISGHSLRRNISTFMAAGLDGHGLQESNASIECLKDIILSCRNPLRRYRRRHKSSVHLLFQTLHVACNFLKEYCDSGEAGRARTARCQLRVLYSQIPYSREVKNEQPCGFQKRG